MKDQIKGLNGTESNLNTPSSENITKGIVCSTKNLVNSIAKNKTSNTFTVEQEFFYEFKKVLEKYYDILRRLDMRKTVNIDNNQLDLLLSTGLLETLTDDNISNIDSELININSEINNLKIELDDKLRKGRIINKRNEYLLKIRKDSRNIFKGFGLLGKKSIRKHLKDFELKYNLKDFSNDYIILDIEENYNGGFEGSKINERKKILSLEAEKLQNDLNSYVNINGILVRLTEKGKNEIPENFVFNKFKEIKELVSKELTFYNMADRNLITMQFLNLSIREPDKLDEYINKFKELFKKVSEEKISCYSYADRNFLAMQFLNLSIREPDKLNEYIDKFKEIKEQVSKELSFYSMADKNSITMQFLNLSIREPDKLDEYINKFKELFKKVSEEIPCYSYADRNLITMQFLNLSIGEPYKLDEYINKFKEIKELVSKELTFYNMADRNLITMQFLNLSIGEPDKLDEYINKFEELFKKVSEEIPCYSYADRNSLAINFLKSILFKISKLKLLEFLQNYGSYNNGDYNYSGTDTWNYSGTDTWNYSNITGDMELLLASGFNEILGNDHLGDFNFSDLSFDSLDSLDVGDYGDCGTTGSDSGGGGCD
ncbi:MAG: hypothetical protein PHG82_02570 [Candidatus Gracilibacteria bacterium]|nr:hypothetical protein [Candidatus Gracilibacteria bacterium]